MKVVVVAVAKKRYFTNYTFSPDLSDKHSVIFSQHLDS
jgi:hypothetical protein